MKKLLGSSVVVIGLLLAGPQKASTDTLVACINPGATLSGLYIANSGSCPAPGGVSWTQVNLTTTSGQASNVLYTPMLVADQIVSCLVFNRGAQALDVKVEEFTGPTGQFNNQVFFTLQPGAGDIANHNAGLGIYYCKFTVTNGTSSDIVVSIQSTNTTGPVGVAALSGVGQ